MSSPPSLESLKLSSSQSKDVEPQRPSSPSADVETNGETSVQPAATANGSESSINGKAEAAPSEAATPAETPKPNGVAPASAVASTSASRPLPAATASTPVLPTTRAPGRPGIGSARGGATGPMGMRGRGGQPMQARLPPSLQAKMEVSYSILNHGNEADMNSKQQQEVVRHLLLKWV